MTLVYLDLSLKVATEDDTDLFRALVSQYLREMRDKGSEIRPTERTIDAYCGIFKSYVCEPEKGVTLMAGGVGFTMAGDVTLPFDSDFGKTAIGWGTYVDPEFRGRHIADKLRRALRRELRARGFQSVLGGVNKQDFAAMKSVRHTNWSPYQIVGRDDLTRGE